MATDVLPRGNAVVWRITAVAALVLAAVWYIGCEGAVEPDPNPPLAVEPITDRTVTNGDSVVLALSDHFIDPDGDTLRYTARTTGELVAVATVSGAALTVRALSPGQATVTVTATDPGGLSAEQAFRVTVPNRPPEAVGSIAGLQMFTGESGGVDVADRFTDPDGDALTYTVSTRDPYAADTSNVAVSVSGAVVTVTAVFPGEATVTVTATDEGGLTAEQSFAVTVPNRAPEAVGAIAGVEVFKYDDGRVWLTGHFTDPDGEVLRYAAETSNGGVAAASVSGDTLTVQGVAQGRATITVRASDPGGLAAEQTVAVTVPNRAPGVAGTMPGVEVFKYDSAAMAVSAYFTDPDGDELTYGAATSNGGVAAVEVAGDRVTVLAVVQGRAVVTVTASDSAGASAEQAFEVTVPNRPPGAVGSVPGVEVFKYDASRVDVSGYFADPDGDELAYRAETSNGVVAAVAVAGDRVTVSGMAQGEAVVTVTASDSAGASAEQVFEVTVPNRPPGAVGSIPEVAVFKYDTGRVDVSAYFADPDRDELSYAAATSNGGVAAVWVSGDGVVVSGVVQGRAEVTVVASDSAGASAEQAFVVTVPNRAPEAVGELAGLELFRGDSGRTEVSGHFSDPDGDELSYAVETSDPDVAAVSVSGGTVSVSARSQGQAVVTVVASDSAGAAAGQAFKVTVPNRAPEAVGALAALELFRGDSGRTEVSGNFSDPDEDPLGYAVETSDRDVAVAWVAGGTVGVRATGQGETAVTVTATDPHGGSAEQTFTVTVPNRSPGVVREMPAMELFKGDLRGLDASAHFGDPDGDALAYAAESADAGVVTVSVSGAVVTVGGVGQGEAEVTVTAGDPHGGSAAQTFTVTVPNRAPEVIEAIPDVGTSPGGSRTLDLARHLRDPDGDALAYAAVSSDAGVAAVSLSGGVLTVWGLADGTAEVTVTARDPLGASAGQDFTVTVLNRAPEPAGSIADVELLPGDTAQVDVTEHFTDPDGDALTYTVVTSSGGVAAVHVSEGTVSVRGVSRGRVEVTVTASDPLGLTARQTFAVTVPNRAPVVTRAMPAMEAFTGDSRGVDASGHFADPDGDVLAYAAASSNPVVVQVSVSRETVTVAPVGRGEAEVTVTASDPAGASARQSFVVTVPNRAPEVAGLIPYLEVPPDGSAEVDLYEYFADPDGDALDYAAESSDTSVAAVSVSGETLGVSGLDYGTVTVTVTASDSGDLTAEQQFEVTVEDPNRAPEPAGSIPNAELMPDSSSSVNASRYFTDPDADLLVYTAVSSDTEKATVEVSGSTVTVTGEAEGSAEITVTATDPDELSATQEFTVAVRTAARSDLVVELPDADPAEVAPGEEFTLSVVVRNRGGAAASSGTTLRYYRSPDGTITTGDTEIDTDRVPTLGAAKSSGASIEVTAPSGTGTYYYGACADAVGNESDTGNNCSTAAEVTVTQSNRAPRAVGTIPDADIQADGSLGLEVAGYFTDPDSDPLTYTARSSNTAKATVTVSGSTITITGQATGSARITVTATDPDGLSATQRFTVTVRTTARSDLVVESPEADPDEVAPGEAFALSVVVRNRGGAAASSGTTLRYYRSPDGTITTGDTEIGTDQVPTLGAAKTSSESVEITSPSEEGTYYYGACADSVNNESDTGNNCSAAARVRVTQSNRAPRAVGTIPNTDILPDSSTSRNVSAYFTDPDSDPLTYTARSSNAAKATVTVSGSTVTITGQATGSARVTVTATDPDGLSATQRFTVTVRAKARSDLVVESAGADPDEVAPGGEFTLGKMVRNQGGGDASSGTMLRYYRSADAEIDTDDTEIDTDDVPKLGAAKTSSESVEVTGPTEEGTYYYGACADSVNNESDTKNNCSEAVEVKVMRPNRAPEPVGTIPADTVVEDWYEYTRIGVTKHFTDPDGDELEYSASSSDTDAASVRVGGSEVTIIGNAEGSADITVTATDPGGLSADQSFTVTVLGPRSELWVLSMFALPDSLGTNDNLRLDMWMRNSGNAASSSAPAVRFYLSDDKYVGRDDTELNAVATRIVQAGSDVLTQWSTVAPSDTGTYYYGSCIDAVDNDFNKDNNCSPAQRVRVVDVRGENRHPVYYRSMTTMTVAEGDSASVNLNRHFYDPDDDTLTFRPTSDDTTKASVSVSDSVLTVKGVKEGKTTGTVRATDPDGLWVEGYFDVCVKPCVINPSRFYLTQAVQSLSSTTPTEVPLVADEKALLRVFVVASRKGDAVIPKVRATFVKPGEWTRQVNIPAGSEKIPLEIDQSDLDKSANAEISASWIEPDVRVHVTIDPDNTLPDSLKVNKRIPRTGSWTIDARTVPTLELTAVPFIWTEDPDSTVEEWATSLVDSTDFAPAQYPFELMPVKKVDGSVHDVVETDSNSTYVLLRKTKAIRVAENGTGYYMGIFSQSDPNDRGLAELPGWVSVSIMNGRIVGHELGHSFSLSHAPSCDPNWQDPDYPYPDGQTGKWGYDFRGDSVLPPSTPDLMGYCDDPWISDYHFNKALLHRTVEEYRSPRPASQPAESLLLWGGVDSDGHPFLESVLAIDAVPSPPTEPGPYRIAGRAEDGTELFSFRFDMPEVADGDGGSVFAFVIPVQAAWAGTNLAGVTLFAGSRSATLDRNTDRPLVFLRDPVTRQIRGIFRRLTDATLRRIEAAKRRGLEVLTSRGIPDLRKR